VTHKSSDNSEPVCIAREVPYKQRTEGTVVTIGCPYLFRTKEKRETLPLCGLLGIKRYLLEGSNPYPLHP